MATRYVRGDRETVAAFRELARYVATPANEASRYALRPLLAEAKLNIDRMDISLSGLLKRALTIKRDNRSPRTRPRYLVGPRAGSPAVRYAHLVELGTDPHPNAGQFPDTLHPGTTPKPFLRMAFEATKELVVQRFGERIGPAIEARAAKLARKVAR
ncbi:MAG: hypothetical protein RO009_17140 [Pseudorhodoplanes sp.]|jgi:hypothetical protein|nr:hypothetical protein [Pseudorhodoplanes sp.]